MEEWKLEKGRVMERISHIMAMAERDRQNTMHYLEMLPMAEDWDEGVHEFITPMWRAARDGDTEYLETLCDELADYYMANADIYGELF